MFGQGPCAWLDTDEDGQPDRIECPPGFTTSLFEDQDDDGDGTPDELEGSSMGDSEDNSTPIIFIGAILILVHHLLHPNSWRRPEIIGRNR